MGCLIQIVFSKSVDGERKGNFYKRHKKFLNGNSTPLSEEEVGSKEAVRFYVPWAEGMVAKYLHEKLKRDRDVSNTKIIS